MRATAEAHPNIALIKYWGKKDRSRNLPAVGSLSITLDGLRSRTEVEFDEYLQADRVALSGADDEHAVARVRGCLDHFRSLTGWDRHAHVRSEGNFPLAAGLASSASGFAALSVAADAAAGTGLSPSMLASLAGAASGSAARSIFGGFVRLDPPRGDESDITVRELVPGSYWPLEVVIAITDTGAKAVSSTEAMLSSAETSPYYRRWVADQAADLDEAEAAVREKDFVRLAAVAEFSCLKMHSLTLSSRPAIIYWKPATLACLQAVREMRAQGHGVFFTVDAGPQVKAVCLPGSVDRVAEVLAKIPGVCEILRTGLGGGARVVERA